ncbi:MAG: serine/threonine protein kinase [Phycisphaerae bacterium]|nr:serine/threonine protein kinase [Phycisphaerae bacterium]
MPDSHAPSEVPRWDGSADPERAALALAEAALDLSPEARGAWLTTACAHFPHLKPRVEMLIEASELAESCDELPPFLTLPHIDDLAAQPAAPFSWGAGPMRLAAGTTFGRYRIERFVAAGGMGEVYEAREDALGRRVAIKILSAAATASRSRRFVYEAGLMARLEHPGIARLYEWSEANLNGVPTPFIAMEFIDGRPIAQAAADLPDVRARAALCVQVCEAVAYAHSRGIIHRDLKPANILVDGEGRARVLDFGIGSLLDPAARSNLSITEGAPRPGTLAYMSPEQLRGGAESISTLSDVYSLGLVLYEVFAGRPALPFRDEPIDAIIRDVLEEDPPALGRIIPECRGDLEAIVSFAIRKDSKARYPSSAALGEDLSRFLRGEPVLARVPGPWERVRHFARRRRVLTASIAAAAVALATGLSIAAVQYRRAISSERVAQKRLNDARLLAKTLLFDFSDAARALPASAPIRATLAERAVNALSSLAQDSDDPDLLADLAEGYLKLSAALGMPGDVNLGQFTRASDLTRAACDLAERVVELAPSGERGWMILGNANLQASFAGDKTQFISHARASIECYSRAWELLGNRLDTPQGAAAAQKLAYAQRCLAFAESGPGRPSELYDSALTMYDRLIELTPGDQLLRQTRASVLASYASVLRPADPGKARQLLARAATELEGLLDMEGAYSSVRHLAFCRVDLGLILLDEGRIAEAISMTDSAAALVDTSAEQDPAHSIIRSDQIESAVWKANIRLLAARRPEISSSARTSFAEEAIECLEPALSRQLATPDPSPRDLGRVERIQEALKSARGLLADKEKQNPER